jgi:hypothetical protein
VAEELKTIDLTPASAITSASAHIKKPRIRDREYDEYRAAFDDDDIDVED